MVLNRLDTVVAMVEAGHGTGIVPSYALPACQRRRVVASRLINPNVPVDFYQIRSRGRKLSQGAEEFTAFLQAYIARWAGRTGLPPESTRVRLTSTGVGTPPHRSDRSTEQ